MSYRRRVYDKRFNRIGIDNKDHNKLICINCFKTLAELTQELSNANNPEYNDLNKIVENFGWNPSILETPLNLIENTNTCITKDEAIIKDIIE